MAGKFTPEDIFRLYYNEIETLKACEPVRQYIKNAWDVPLNYLERRLAEVNAPEEVKDQVRDIYREVKTLEFIIPMADSVTVLAATGLRDTIMKLRKELADAGIRS